MNNSAGNQRYARLASKVVRRFVGFLLLCFAVGLSTCAAFESTMDAQRHPPALEQPRR